MKEKSLVDKIKTSSNSVKWTALFAVIAVASILAIGLKPISFAADMDTIPDSFTVDTRAHDHDNALQVYGTYAAGGLEVNKVTGNSGAFHAYCYELGKAFPSTGQVYTNKTPLDKELIAYIIANGYPNETLDGYSEMEQIWITQVAVWHSQGVIEESRIINIKSVAAGSVTGHSTHSGAELWAQVEALVAKAQTTLDTVNTISFDINANFSTTSDGKYMQSNLITVTGAPENLFKTFDIVLDGAPEGTIILDSSGEQMSALTGIPVNEQRQFYIRIPVDNITNDTQTFVAKVKGYFSSYKGFTYTTSDSSYQKLVVIEPGEKTVETVVQVSLNQSVDVPDTASSSGKAIYFVGLIILLSGAGIIYANIKPREQE